MKGGFACATNITHTACLRVREKGEPRYMYYYGVVGVPFLFTQAEHTEVSVFTS